MLEMVRSEGRTKKKEMHRQLPSRNHHSTTKQAF